MVRWAPIPSPIYSKSLASDARQRVLDAFLSQAEVCARQRLCPSISLRLLLKTLDGIPNFWVVVPIGSVSLLEDPTTRGTNTKAEFSIYGVVFMLQGPDGACYLLPPLNQLVGIEICQLREWV